MASASSEGKGEDTLNSQRFDELARGLAGARSRRDVLKALTGAIVAGAGTIMVQRGATFAQESCTTDDDCGTEEICCAGFCRPIECCIDDANPNARCPQGTSCFEGVCDPIGAQTGCTFEGGACSADAECCAGICCAGFCRPIECCIDEANPNARCPAGTSCFEGVCDPIRATTTPTPSAGTTAPPKTGGPVTLPNTGSGAASAGQEVPMSAVLAAGAAAAFTARKFLQRSPDAGSND